MKFANFKLIIFLSIYIFSFVSPTWAQHNKNISISSPFELFFKYTPEILWDHLGAKEFIQCQTSLSMLEDGFTLDISLKMNSSNIKNQYGTISKNSPLIFDMLDGSRIELNCIKDAEIIIDKEAQTTYYETSYRLNKQQLEDLRSKLLDKVNIIWTSGKESYPIHHLNYFQIHWDYFYNH